MLRVSLLPSCAEAYCCGRSACQESLAQQTGIATAATEELAALHVALDEANARVGQLEAGAWSCPVVLRTAAPRAASDVALQTPRPVLNPMRRP